MWLWRKFQRLSRLLTLFDTAVSLSSHNYFEIFSLPQAFKVDIDTLEQAYRNLQASHHPDRVAGADDAERLQALQQTSLINDAYDTLKSPVKRAAYLLSLGGVNPDEHNQAHLQPDFLLTQMELRERLEELEDEENIEGLDAMKAEVCKDRDAELVEFESAWLAGDQTAAKAVYHKLQFLFKLLDEIDAAEEKLLDY